MPDDFDAYYKMKQEGIDAPLTYLWGVKQGLDPFASIRMLRAVYGLSLAEAKEITVTADGSVGSLTEHQQRLFPALKEVLDSRRAPHRNEKP